MFFRVVSVSLLTMMVGPLVSAASPVALSQVTFDMKPGERWRATLPEAPLGDFLALIGKNKPYAKMLDTRLYGYAKSQEGHYAVFVSFYVKAGSVYFSSGLSSSEQASRRENLGLFAYTFTRQEDSAWSQQAVRRLGNTHEYEPTVQGSLYGCFSYEIPVSKIDINGDGVAELLLVSGVANGITDGILEFHDLNLLRGDTFAPLLSTRLKTDNYSVDPENLAVGLGRYATVRFDDRGYMLIPAKPGLRSYAKLFFADFDGDKSSDLLVWRRAYQGEQRRQDESVNWEFAREEFELYTFGENLDVTKKPVSVGAAHKWLTAGGLTWKDGFPNTNVCSGSSSTGPMVPNIDDPVVGK